MAAPNLLTVTSVTGKTAVAALTTSALANILTNASGSGTVAKINNITLTNYSATTVNINVAWNRSSNTYFIGASTSVPPNSTLTLIGKDTSLYLEEGDNLQANASSASAIHILTSYELMG